MTTVSRPASPAWLTMHRLNPNMFAAIERDHEVFIEDVPDPDGRWYRIEYRCRPDGTRSLAYCLHSPWPPSRLSIVDTHLMPDGSICTSDRAHRGGERLAFTVERARFWCVGYSFLQEHGLEATRRALGSDW